MNRGLIKELYHFFSSIQDRSEEEDYFLTELQGRLPYFDITSVSRDDLQSLGFNVSEVDDATMKRIASKMSDDYCDQLYWSSLDIIADFCGVKKHICPFCKKHNINYSNNSYTCSDCGAEWKDTYVLAEHPNDTSYFESKDIGYPCYNSDDNSARYITEYEYLLHYQKKPSQNSYYIPVQWPESQNYMEGVLNDSHFALCEPILGEEKALKDFGDSAIWVPLCLIG